jgi:glc operon protein GlcG
MKNKPTLTLEDVRAIAQAAESEATTHQWAVTMAIVDDGGHLLWLQRLESKVYEDMINQGRYSFLSAPVLEGMLEGGVPIIVDGQCIGAVGISGVKSNEDAQIARAGIAALGL